MINIKEASQKVIEQVNSLYPNRDGFVKSPNSLLRCILRFFKVR